MLGVLNHVPVKVRNLHIPTGFVVMDIEEDRSIPIFPGRPFMATTETIIYVKHGMLTIEVGEDRLRFYLPNDHDLFYTQNFHYNLNLIREKITWGGPKKKER